MFSVPQALVVYLALQIVATLMTAAILPLAGGTMASCDGTPAWACGSPMEGIVGALNNVNLTNPLTLFRLIPGSLQSLLQLAILDYDWLPTDGILSVPVYALRAMSALLMTMAIIRIATQLSSALTGRLGRFV